MKKKIVALCLVLALALTAVGGATLAYFQDNDAQTNVFTVGNVDIDLWENYGDNDETTPEVLRPVTFGPDGKKLPDNQITKEIYVTNDGSEDAFVRIHFAIPAAIDRAYPDFDASENIVHWNFWNYGNKQWNWTPDAKAAGYEANNWNFYEETIDGVKYNVYVATYETALEKDQTTPYSVYKIYMDSKTTNEVIEEINKTLKGKWQILVAAEGVQAEGFADAYTALNTAFGTPQAGSIDWTAVSGETFGNP